MSLIPKEKTKRKTDNPKNLIMFGLPKVGKTTLLSMLPKCLIVDFEDGTDYVESYAVKISNYKQLFALAKELKETPGQFDFIAFDTTTALEDIALPYANKLYRDTVMGKNFDEGENVLKLPNGAGYQYLREAMNVILNEIEQLCDTLIILGHLKSKFVEKEGKEMEARGLALTGKIAAILCSQVDAIGYVYRDENKTLVNFAPSESLVVGSRPDHLKNKTITLIESDDNGKLTINWDEIFIE